MMLFVSIIYICAAVKPIPSVLTAHQEFYLQFLFEGLMSSHAGGKMSTVSMYTDTKADGKTNATGKGNTDNQLGHAWDLPSSPLPSASSH